MTQDQKVVRVVLAGAALLVFVILLGVLFTIDPQ